MVPDSGDHRHRTQADGAGHSLGIERPKSRAVATSPHHQHDVGRDTAPRRGSAQGRDEIRHGVRTLEGARDRGHSDDPGALPASEFARDIAETRRTRGMHHCDSHDVGQGRQASLPVVEPLALETRANLFEGAPHQAFAQSLR